MRKLQIAVFTRAIPQTVTVQRPEPQILQYNVRVFLEINHSNTCYEKTISHFLGFDMICLMDMWEDCKIEIMF